MRFFLLGAFAGMVAGICHAIFRPLRSQELPKVSNKSEANLTEIADQHIPS